MEISKVVKFGEKFGEVTAILSKSKSNEVVYSNRNISKSSYGETSLLHIRISKGKKFGYATTRILPKWKEAVLEAAKIMKLSREMEQDIPIIDKQALPTVKGIYHKDVDSLGQDKLFGYGESLLSGVDKKFIVPKAEVSNSYEEIVFGNSNNVMLNSKSTFFSSSIEVSNSKLNFYEYHTLHKAYNPKVIGKKASDMLKLKLNPKPIKSFKGDVFLDYFAVADLIESVIVPAISADNVQSKRSVLAGKVGQKIFSDKLTIYDNGIMRNGLSSSPFDGEGNPRRKTLLVKEGVLKNYLYDTYSAEKDGTKSTGNSNGINKVPNIAPTNFVVGKGDFSKEEMLSEVRKGVYVREVFGTHLINPLTGDCSVGAENVFFMRNGKFVHPVKQAMISFNLFDALKKVEIIGKSAMQESSIKSPPMVIKNVQVIG